MTAERYLSADDIAARLGVRKSRAYEVMRGMPHVKFGRNLRVSETNFTRWVEAHTRPALVATAPPAPPAPLDARGAAQVAKRRRVLTVRAAVRAGTAGDGSTIRLTRPRD